MFILYANKNRLIVRQREPITSGSINVSSVRFEFSAEWEGLARTAIFRAGTESRAALLGEDNETVIPWEVLRQSDLELFCGVYGTQGGHTVLPTIWASLGAILAGASPEESVQPPTPDLWRQELARKGDGLRYDGLNLSLLSGDNPLATVQVAGGGGYVPVPGPQGVQGPKGEQGGPGKDATINGKNAITLAAGQNVTIETGDDGTVTISAAGGGSGESVTAGDGLSKEGDTLSVDNPVRGILTQAEFDALPEAQKSKGTYFVDDGQTGGTSWNTYSTEEQIIGTWVDGRPLYRKVLEATAPSVLNKWTTLFPPILDAEIRIMKAILFTYDNCYVSVPIFSTSSRDLVCVYITESAVSPPTSPGLAAHVGNSQYLSRPMTVILEYTKTTDLEAST